MADDFFRYGTVDGAEFVSAGDVVRFSDGEPMTVTAVGSQALMFDLERGWLVSVDGGAFEPWSDEDDS